MPLPPKIEIDLERVNAGRVQMLTRITMEDRNDFMRVVNYLGWTQQDVMRMLLVQGIRKVVAFIQAEQPSAEPAPQTLLYDPEQAPGAAVSYPSTPSPDDAPSLTEQIIEDAAKAQEDRDDSTKG
jgi:hypothetical protein